MAACTIDTYALLSLDDAKSYLGLTDDELQEDAFTIYNDESDSATAATVQLLNNTLTLVVTTGANAGPATYDLTAAANDTLGELTAAIITNDKGWVVTQHARDAIITTDLKDKIISPSS